MDYKHLTFTRAGHVATVTLNRPDRLNALSLDLMEEIERVAIDLRGDCESRVVIFTGEGEHFSAGADLKDTRRAGSLARPMIERMRLYRIGARMIRQIFDIEQITIAAVNGYALGGGACIASAADFRIGAADCRVGYPEIDLAMNLSWNALPLLVHLVGPARAKRMVVLGEKLDAGTLREWGFLDQVAPAGRLLETAAETAALYAAKPPLQAQMIKRSVNAIASALDASVMHMDLDQFLLAGMTKDHAEGIAAFLQKRPPDFKGD